MSVSHVNDSIGYFFNAFFPPVVFHFIESLRKRMMNLKTVLDSYGVEYYIKYYSDEIFPAFTHERFLSS